MPTLKDVAREAGVAVSTASLALQGKPRVSAETRRRVLRVAEKLGYQSNAAASILGRQRAQHRVGARQVHIALLRCRPGTSILLEGARGEAKQQGYEVLEEQITRSTDLAAFSRSLWHRGVGGIILEGEGDATVSPADLPWDAFDWSRFSAVKIARVLPALHLHSVRASAAEITMNSLKTIFSYGYRRLLFLYTSSSSMLDNVLRRALPEHYRQHLLPEGTSLDIVDVTSQEQKLVDEAVQKHRPDAVLAFPTAMIKVLTELGYKVPQDFGFAGWPLFSLTNEYFEPHPEDPFFAGVDTRRDLQGIAAVRLVHQLISTGETGLPQIPTETLISPVWRDGRSLPRRRR